MANIFEPGVFSAAAGADLSAEANLGKFVKLSAGTVVLCDTAGEKAIGVLANLPELGQPAEVHCGRVTKIRGGASLSAMALVKTDTAGKAAAAVLGRTDTSDAGAAADPLLGSFVMGMLYEAVADGELAAGWVGHIGAAPTTMS